MTKVKQATPAKAAKAPKAVSVTVLEGQALDKAIDSIKQRGTSWRVIFTKPQSLYWFTLRSMAMYALQLA